MNATSIPCPHCEGDGLATSPSGEGWSYCAVCYEGEASVGWLDLPLTENQAHRIYDAACGCCIHLVSGDYDLTSIYLPPEQRPITGSLPIDEVDEDVTTEMKIGK